MFERELKTNFDLVHLGESLFVVFIVSLVLLDKIISIQLLHNRRKHNHAKSKLIDVLEKLVVFFVDLVVETKVFELFLFFRLLLEQNF